MSKMDKINNIAFDLMNEQVDEFTLFEKLKEIHELSLQPQLNDNQQIVLDWLKDYQVDDSDFQNTIYASKQLMVSGIPYKEEEIAFAKLKDNEFAQVLEVFAKWAQEQEIETE